MINNFRIVIVSEQFNGKSLLQQHRSIHEILKEELNSGVHALALQTIPSSKWSPEVTPEPNQSPKCLGGMKREMKEKE